MQRRTIAPCTLCLLTALPPGHKKGQVNKQTGTMTSSRLLKALAFLSLSCLAAAAWIWHATGEPPGHWLLRIAGMSFFAALIVAIVSPDTRPRLLMRFLAALFALFALISFAADISRPIVDGQSPGTTSLLQHMQTLAPTFVAALQRTTENATATFVWNPVLTSILSMPAWLIFLLLAVGTGFLGRPRRRVRIFVNDY